MPDQILQEIKDRLNVAEVIGGYIPVKKVGVNFKALCPFHGEKTASLVISPQKQIWHCFGCGEGGDIFGFVTRYENLEFREALKILADRAGVKLPEYRPQDPRLDDEKQRLLRINDFAARFYNHLLLKDKRGTEALDYLKNRGLNLATIEKWQIGFAPDDFHTLEEALKSKNVPAADLLKAGVSAKNERGQIYDRFRGRITFPIFNYVGEVVAFSARILKDKPEVAKYINSPETLIYNKSQILFGLNFAKETIRKKDEVVIVEGQMDCISVHQAGFLNVVATSGTALTHLQLTTLSRQTKNLKFCFDLDNAGLTASRRAGELALKQGFKLKVVLLKNVKDPDELIKKSPGLWEKAVHEAVWFLDFYLDLAKRHAPEDKVERLHFINENIGPLISFIQNPLEQGHYIKRIMDQYELPEKSVREMMKPQKVEMTRTPVVAQISQAQNTGLLEKEILGGILKFPDFAKKVSEETQVEEFKDPTIRHLLVPLFRDNSPDLDSEEAVAKEALFMVELQLEEAQGNDRAVLRDLDKSFSLFKTQQLKAKALSLNSQIKLAEQQKDKANLAELQKEFARISALRMKYERQI